ncbi:serine protease 53 isoform X7 [Meles meles]|uniref:serine protease 53 isoform X7 n=1 Tax=Meles meles TaxID=9662 RepID=UPI001E6A0FFD|nr:serine protease 53 isoform X7 [Meles meles]
MGAMSPNSVILNPRCARRVTRNHVLRTGHVLGTHYQVNLNLSWWKPYKRANGGWAREGPGLRLRADFCPSFTYPWCLSWCHCLLLCSVPQLYPSPSRAAMTELNSWSVVLGSLQREGLSPGAEAVGVTALQLPRAYNHYSQGSDLALLQLAQPTARTPLCLPQSTHRFPFGTSCWATGWDQDTNGGKCWPSLKPREALRLPRVTQPQLPTVPLLHLPCSPPSPFLLLAPRTLRNLRLRLISRPTCNCLYNRLHQRLLASPARPGMLCGGAQPGVQGPCQGDSGGPVLCREPDGHWVQAGIISFASSCAQEDTPVLLTSTAAHSSWLCARAQGAAFLSQNPGTPEISDEDSCVACGSLRREGPQAGAPSPWPWDARLMHQGKLACGGALVSEEVVLTAAHCFIGRQTPEEWSIRLASGLEERGLKQLILHGAYTHPEGGYDVALLLLAQPVTLGPSLRPLCLPYSDHHLPDGERGWVLGLPRPETGPAAGCVQLLGATVSPFCQAWCVPVSWVSHPTARACLGHHWCTR